MQVRILNDDADGTMTVVFNIETHKERVALMAINAMNVSTPDEIFGVYGTFCTEKGVSRDDVKAVMRELYLAFKVK